MSTPSDLVEVGFVDTPGNAVGVALWGGYAYVAGGGFSVIDVSTPSAPVQVGFLDGFGGWDVVVLGDYQFVTWHGQEHSSLLTVIDIQTPSAPVEVGSFVPADLGALLGCRSLGRTRVSRK